MSYFNDLKEKIKEICCCTLEVPLEIVQLICAPTIKVHVKNQIERNAPPIEVRTCCYVDVDRRYTIILAECYNTNQTNGRGHTCTHCKQWFCSEHQELHKFCMYCGKQMYRKLEKEIDNQHDTKEIIDLLLLEEEEKQLSLEEEEDRLYLRNELETIEKTHDMYCCRVFKVEWAFKAIKSRCSNDAIKYCSECDMCFCGKHQVGFCRCGKVVSLTERYNLLKFFYAMKSPTITNTFADLPFITVYYQWD